MECKARVIVERETLEKLIREQTEEMIRGLKEVLKDQGEEIENLREKVRRLEQGTGKRKRNDDEESTGRREERKWWSDEGERNDDERRKKNVIVRIEKERWTGKGTNREKVKQLFSEGLKLWIEVKEVSVIGLREEWLTMLVRLGSEEDKWRVLEARRRVGSKLKVKMDEDKSIDRRLREGEEKKKRKERREEDGGRPKRSAEEEIASRLEESLLMDSDEERGKTKAD